MDSDDSDDLVDSDDLDDSVDSDDLDDSDDSDDSDVGGLGMCDLWAEGGPGSGWDVTVLLT